MEDEDVSAGSGTGEAAGGRVEHVAEVGVQLVKSDWLVQSARGEVCRASGREGHAELGERVHVYGHQSVRALGVMGTSIGGMESVSLIPESRGYAPSRSGLLS